MVFVPLLCRSEEEYFRVCSSPERNATLIPIIERSPPWPIQEVFGVGRQECSSAPGVDNRGPLEFETALEWARLQTHHASLTQSTRPATLTLVAEGPCAPAAAILATTLGYRLQICPGGLADQIRNAVRGAQGRPTIIVACRNEATDDLLMSLSNETVSALASETAWELLPKVTMLTARDLTSLSWVVAKTIAAHNGQHVCTSSRHVSHYTPAGDSIELREVEGTPQSGFEICHRHLDRAALRASLSRPVAVTGYQTHGVDACAHGGDGLVLCGLHKIGRTRDAGLPGILGCARGYPCPRGPEPFPLSRTGIGVFMLGSCNGLRLADGILDPDFNLGLSFLDGIGYAYVSNIAAGFGTEIGTICFLAAFASGRSLAEATLLVNALVHAARLDSPSYIAVGLPECKAAGVAGNGGPHQIKICAQKRVQINFGHRHCAEILIDDPNVVQLGIMARLFLAVSSNLPDEPVFWFYRLERGSPSRGSSPAAGVVLRVFLFRFPHVLGTVEINFDDSDGLRTEVRDALTRVSRWRDLIPLTSSHEEAEAFSSHIIKCESSLHTAIGRRMKGLRFDGSVRPRVANLLRSAEHLAEFAREFVVKDLVPQLTAEFWLTNVWSAEYRFAHHYPTLCPYCGGVASCKILEHEFHVATRAVIVCMRCLIVSDLPHAGDIEAVTIGVPTLVKAGTSMTVSVTVANRTATTCNVVLYPRMASRRGETLAPRPLQATSRLNGRPHTENFHWDLPADLMPHQYRLKVLATSTQEIAFAQRPFFVVPAESASGSGGNVQGSPAS